MIDRRRPRIAVIGGGISGLAAAHRVQEIDPTVAVDLFEAGPHLGGVLRSERRDGYLLEQAADNFITTVPWALDLCRRIGFDDELIPTQDAFRRAFVLRSGKLQPIPAGFAVMAPSRIWPTLSTPILSPLGKLRLAAELLVPKRGGDDDEAMASFVKRRLGREVYERLVQPLVAGIYTADPDRLSLDATMPRFREMEKQHGSLIRGMLHGKKNLQSAEKSASGARYSQFVAPREGMSSFVRAIADRLPSDSIHCNSAVERLATLPKSGWEICFSDHRREPVRADGIILALPSHQAARLLRSVDLDVAEDLLKIEYGSCALASFGFHRDQIAHPLDGFGVVVPLIEGRKILSASFTSIKYAGRAPEGEVLIRAFVGGACQSELLDQGDEALLDLAHLEIADLLGIRGQPRMRRLQRQSHAMPQYHVGHKSLVEKISQGASRVPTLALAGNALHGVGLPHCIKTGESAAAQLVTEIQSRVTSPSHS